MPPQSRTGRVNAAKHAEGICTHCPEDVTDRNKRGQLYWRCRPCRRKLADKQLAYHRSRNVS